MTRSLHLAAFIAAAIFVTGCGNGGGGGAASPVSSTSAYATQTRSSAGPAMHRGDMIVQINSDGTVSFEDDALGLSVHGQDGDQIPGSNGVVYTLHVAGADLSLTGSDGSDYAWTVSPVAG